MRVGLPQRKSLVMKEAIFARPPNIILESNTLTRFIARVGPLAPGQDMRPTEVRTYSSACFAPLPPQLFIVNESLRMRLASRAQCILHVTRKPSQHNIQPFFRFFLPFQLLCAQVELAISAPTVAELAQWRTERRLPDRWLPPATFIAKSPCNEHVLGYSNSNNNIPPLLKPFWFTYMSVDKKKDAPTPPARGTALDMLHEGLSTALRFDRVPGGKRPTFYDLRAAVLGILDSPLPSDVELLSGLGLGRTLSAATALKAAADAEAQQQQPGSAQVAQPATGAPDAALEARKIETGRKLRAALERWTAHVEDVAGPLVQEAKVVEIGSVLGHLPKDLEVGVCLLCAVLGTWVFLIIALFALFSLVWSLAGCSLFVWPLAGRKEYVQLKPTEHVSNDFLCAQVLEKVAGQMRCLRPAASIGTGPANARAQIDAMLLDSVQDHDTSFVWDASYAASWILEHPSKSARYTLCWLGDDEPTGGGNCSIIAFRTMMIVTDSGKNKAVAEGGGGVQANLVQGRAKMLISKSHAGASVAEQEVLYTPVSVLHLLLYKMFS